MSGKYTSIHDIPQFIQQGDWECGFSPQRLLANLDDWVAEQGLDLDPDFQRCHVWSEPQQVAYIEFMMRGGRTARVIYLNHPNWHHAGRKSKYSDFVLVDGKQRIQAWRRFFANEIKAFGSYASDFKDIGSMRCTHTMKINVNCLKTRAEVLQWYIDFNSGGVVHTDEEINRVRKLLEAEKP